MTGFDLRREDCFEGMSRLPNRSVDLVVTSPPYNLGIRYRRYSDRQDRQSYLQWCRKWAAQVGRILESSGSFFLNIGAAPSNPMLPHEIAIELRDVLVLQNTIHWIKSIAIDTAEGRTSAPNPHLNPLSAPPGRDPKGEAKQQSALNRYKIDPDSKRGHIWRPLMQRSATCAIARLSPSVAASEAICEIA